MTGQVFVEELETLPEKSSEDLHQGTVNGDRFPARPWKRSWARDCNEAAYLPPLILRTVG